MENDILSCLRSWSEEASDVQTSAELQFEDNSGCGKPGTLSSADLGTRDDIGEISIEDHSSSAAWGMISQKIVNACSEIFKQKGIFKFVCKHVENAQAFQNGVIRNEDDKEVQKAKLVKDHPPPLGKPLCLRFPPALVGGVYQVWELLSHFDEILGLKEAFSLEELEEELVNPWFGSSDRTEKFERQIQGSQALNSHRIDYTSGQLSSSSESGLAVAGNNPHAFIHMETGAMKEAAQAKLASVTYSRCSGIALTKAHASLLRVLIGELQSKVAALVDPNFDSGDVKSKRGRKKDVDSSIPVKRTKLNILPINELTWPELARRYVLAVLAMDGNLESAEITAS
ncbi:hypothetical protein GBA52_028812 [Prunus armeniaca]|nr:hypothetical protein GBA52_028812 [Prunus armeniaca]